MPRTVTVYVCLVAALAAGCTAPPARHDNLVSEWPAESAMPAGPLPAGTYALHQKDQPELASPPDDRGGQEKDLYGLRGLFCLPSPGSVDFEQGDGGQLFARIGDEKIPLPPGRYCWRSQPAAGEGAEKLTRGRRVVLALHKAGQVAGEVVIWVVVVCVVAGLLILYAMAAGHSS
jgi:hypothetical protein